MKHTLCALLLSVVITSCGQSATDTYKPTVEHNIERIGTAAYQLSQAMSRYKTDPNWRADADAALTQLNTIHTEIVALTPPDRLRITHQKIVAASSECSAAADAYRAAFATDNGSETADDGYRMIRHCIDTLKQLDTRRKPPTL